MKNIHIILFFTLWVILGSCSTYYVRIQQASDGGSAGNVPAECRKNLG